MMFHRNLYFFTLIFIFLVSILSRVSTRAISSTEVWRSWNEEPWRWGDYLEEEFYNTLEVLHDHRMGSNFVELKRIERSATREVTSEFLIKSMTSQAFSRDVESTVILYELLNQKYILINDNVYRIHPHEDGQVFVEFQHMIDSLEYVNKIQTLSHYNHTYCILIYKNHAEVLKIPNDDFSMILDRKFLKQTIQNEDKDTMINAKMFVYQDELYAIVLFSKTSSKSKFGFYRWSGTYFDEIQDILTTSPIDVSVVDLGSDLGIIIGQNSTKKVNAFQIFTLERDGDKKLKRQHDVPTSKDVSMVLGYCRDSGRGIRESYVLLVSRTEKSRIYGITRDGDVIDSENEYDFRHFQLGIVAEVSDKCFLIFSNENKIWIYEPKDDEGLRLVTHFTVESNQTIVALDSLEISGGSHILILLTKDVKDVRYVLIEFETSDNIVVKESENQMEACYRDIQFMLDEGEMEINQLKKQIEKLHELNEYLHSLEELQLYNSKIGELELDIDNEDLLIDDVIQLLENSTRELNLLEDLAQSLLVDYEPFRITKDLEVSREITIENFEASNIEVEKIDTSYLSLNNGDENISEELIRGKTVKAKKLIVPRLKDELEKVYTFQSISAENVFLPLEETINGIHPEDIVTSDYSGFVTGSKTFTNVLTENVVTGQLLEDDNTPWLSNIETKASNILNVDGNMTVDELEVETINGVNIEEFLDYLYLKSKNQTIKGNLHFEKDLRVKNLNTDFIENKAVDKFMTKTTPQVIRSSLAIRNILVRDLDADRINGVDFRRNVAVMGRDNVIRAPTTIFNLDVVHDLILNCGLRNESLCDAMVAEEDDLLQIYNEPVTIRGDLRVRDLRFGKRAIVLVNEQPFRTDTESIYWLSNKHQVIPHNIIFTQGISTSHLWANSINNQPVDGYLMTNQRKNDANIVFKDLLARGDVSVSNQGNCSVVNRLDETLVRKTGRYHIRGRKTFGNRVIARSVNTDLVNGRDVRAVTSKYAENVHFTGHVYVEEMHVSGTMNIYTDISVQYINGFNWNEFVRQAARIDQPASFGTVAFHGLVDADNIRASNTPLMAIASTSPYIPEIDVTVLGSSRIGQVYGTQFINGDRIEELIERIRDQENRQDRRKT